MGQAEEIVRWFETCESERHEFDNTCQEIIDYIDCNHRDITTSRTPGQKKNELQFDGSALDASRIFSDFYQSSVFNEATKWWSARHADEAVNSNPNKFSWITSLRDFVLSQMEGYYGSAGQSINAWGLFGNGALLIEEIAGRKPYHRRIRNTAIPFGTYVWAEGLDNSIDQFARVLMLPAWQIVKRFPKGKFSEELRRCASSSDLKEQSKKFEIIHSILPRDLQTYSKSKIKTNKDYQWASCWVEKDKKVLIEESGYRKFPVAVARMHLIEGETYARGLGATVLADVKSLNKMVELMLLKGARELDPAVLVKRNSVVGGIINIAAKGKTIVNDVHNSIRPLHENSNWPVFERLYESITQQVRRVFHVDEIFNLLTNEAPQRTAFEVNTRLMLLQQILGPVFSHNNQSFFNPSIDIYVDLLAHMVNERGENLITASIGDPPDGLSLGDGAMQIVYEGPLARAQRGQEIIDLQQSVADQGGLQAFWPESAVLPQWEDIARKLWEARGTHGYLKTKDEFAEAVKQLQEQAAAQQQAAMLMGGAEALGKAASGIKVLNENAQAGVG